MHSNEMEKSGPASDDRRGVIRRVAGFLGLAAILMTVPFAAADGGAPSQKPQVPVALRFGTEGPVAVGSPVTVTLTVTPMISSESVAVSITLPDGLSLLDGDVSWTGPLEKRQSHVLTIHVRPELAVPLEVRGLAVLTLPGGSKMSRHAVRMLDLGPNPSKPSLREQHGLQGESILEIPAQSGPKTR
jgi:hypothetical protein